MLLLGDGYYLEHISKGWNAARYWCKELPEQCPSIGVCCYWGREEPDGRSDWWLAAAAFYPAGDWMIAEHLVFRQAKDVTWRAKNEAFKRAVPTMVGIATAHGKRLLFPSSSKGVTAILRNMGVAYSSGLDLLVGP